ncbi:hypothetical protein [Saccharopolyspora shandongensis]|uniref:hypothetical protein n=1 Tax=Saccharopolyspora shandongensis TaxID=418495 RepID=UPI000B86B84F|nr:hypothetical protein [Saccharopolyspora shandongensis]
MAVGVLEGVQAPTGLCSDDEHFATVPPHEVPALLFERVVHAELGELGAAVELRQEQLAGARCLRREA